MEYNVYPQSQPCGPSSPRQCQANNHSAQLKVERRQPEKASSAIGKQKTPQQWPLPSPMKSLVQILHVQPQPAVLNDDKSPFRRSLPQINYHLPQPRLVCNHEFPPRYSSFSSDCSDMADMDIELMAPDEHPNFLPPARRSRNIMRRLHIPYLSIYKRILLLVFVPNLFLVFLSFQHGITNWPVSSIANVVAANITIAIVMRQEVIVNLLLALCGKCPQWAPGWFRRSIAKIYHLGGIHSGCGLAACCWWVSCNWIIARNQINGKWGPLLIFTGLIDLFLAIILVMAIPALRRKRHDWFEWTHRYLGWATIASFWAYLFSLAADETDLEHPYGMILLKSPVFWCLSLVTVALMVPWAMMKKVSVRAEILGNLGHAVRLHFNHTSVPRSAVVKLAHQRLLDWHPFAAIPAEEGKGFSVIVSKAGDWTTRTIKSPPTEIWIRGISTRGLLHIAPLFSRILLVCTGSGIGPILGLTLSKPDLNYRILWMTTEPLATYGKDVRNLVLMADPRARIIRTDPNRRASRPDLAVQAYYLYKAVHVDAVFVISNAKSTSDVVEEQEILDRPVHPEGGGDE